jgi:hypothetical protein
MTGSYPSAILIIVPVNNIMAAVFDAPVAAVRLENTETRKKRGQAASI